MFKNGIGKQSRVRADNVKNFEVKSSRIKQMKPPKVNIMVRGQRITLGDVEVKGEKLSCDMCKRKGLSMKDGRCSHCTKETKKFKPKDPIEQRIKEITPQYRSELGRARSLKELEEVKSDYHWRKFKGGPENYGGDFDDLAYKYRGPKGRNAFGIISEIGDEYVDKVLRHQWRDIKTVGGLYDLRKDIDHYFGGIGILKETPYVGRIRNEVDERIKKARAMKFNW